MGRRRSTDHRAEGLLDRDVVERARSGDQEAFADLVHQISDTLLGVARRIVRDPTLAEDVLQNALLTIWRKLPHLREADRFEGWAFRSLVHACYADAPRNRRWASTIRVLHTDVMSDADDIQMISDRDELEGAFADSRSTSARSSFFITTWACPSRRWPRCSESRTGLRDHVCTTRLGRFARHSSSRGRHRKSEKGDRHERHAGLRSSR